MHHIIVGIANAKLHKESIKVVSEIQYNNSVAPILGFIDKRRLIKSDACESGLNF